MYVWLRYNSTKLNVTQTWLSPSSPVRPPMRMAQQLNVSNWQTQSDIYKVNKTFKFFLHKSSQMLRDWSHQKKGSTYPIVRWPMISKTAGWANIFWKKIFSQNSTSYSEKCEISQLGRCKNFTLQCSNPWRDMELPFLMHWFFCAITSKCERRCQTKSLHKTCLIFPSTMEAVMQ